jgi:spoIIIJ-associated protein
VTDAQDLYPGTDDTSDDEGCPAVIRFCGDLVTRLKFELTVEATELEGTITINLSGPDRPYLLSNTASLLNSIEYILNKAFRTGKGARIAAILLDSDNYRRHREAELNLLAEMAAKKVIAQRKPLTLQPMTPRERRIVHLALAVIPGVRSQSDGEGDNRSITIHPA